MMRKTTHAVLLIGAILVALTGVAVAQDGELTLEGLAERVANIFDRQNDIVERLAALETRMAPTAIAIQRSTPTPTSQQPPPTPTPTSQQPTPTATALRTPTPEPMLRVSAEDLFDDYRIYEGMTFEVSGIVIKKWDDSVELDVPGWFSYFICWLAPDQKDLPLVLKNRQRVVLLGNSVSKESNTVSMRGCAFVSPSPVELGHLNATRVASTATARSVEATATIKAQKTRRSERATQEAVKATATATYRHQGFHCLSAWDGNSRRMNDLIKTYLNDPNSMEVHSTRIAPEVDGTHVVIVDFGAKNALGGVVRNIARGLVDHETCEALVILDIEAK